MELSGRKVLVLGLGETGMSMARWLAGRGALVRVADSRAQPPHADRLAAELPNVVLETGPFRPSAFVDADVLAISPGIPLAEPLVQEAAQRGVPVVGDIELFARFKPQGAQVVAITGSNGKSTVTAMTGAIAQAAGRTAVMAGNYGLPVLDALDAEPRTDLYVLELSSFQLETTSSLDPVAATMLNVSQDHLDRYDGMAAYAAAKARIFLGTGIQVLNRDDAWSMAMRLPGRTVRSFGLGAPDDDTAWGVAAVAGRAWLARGGERLLPVDELGVPGLHNAANALAAMALCHELGIGADPMRAALRAFEGLPHRVQPVAERDSVVFYDDSKGTNVGATVAALNGLGKRCVLIAGGDGKGQDFAPLAEPVRAHARAVVLIGRDRERIAGALATAGVPLIRADAFDVAIRLAFEAATPGDAVLLSPACASYDMFRSYVHRGQEFARLARILAGSAGSGR
jgi:UDP-N-acetylmuramoylalanine--D-glutamate ligase